MGILKSINKKANEVKKGFWDWVDENELLIGYGFGVAVGAMAGAAIMGVSKDVKFADILNQIGEKYISKSNLDIVPIFNHETGKAGLAVLGDNIFGEYTQEIIEVSDPNQVAAFADSMKKFAVKAGATVEAVPEVASQVDVVKELDKVLESVDNLKKVIA